MRNAVVLALVLAAAALAAPAYATTYYVSPRGDDAAAGTRAEPWRTLERANREQLGPGDGILLEGGATFEGPLVPWGSGSPAAPIRIGSYGTGRATVASRTNNIVWLNGNSYVVIENLSLTSRGADNHIVASNPEATTSHITIRNCVIANTGAFGINSPSLTDHHWRIERNTVAGTDETGITFRGRAFRVVGNRIVGTGLDPSEGAHGIYAKGPGAYVVDNNILGFAASGVSIRYENSVVERNRITGGLIGVSQFQDAEVTNGGHSRIAGNTISKVSEAGIYLDGSTLERFTIARNRIAGKVRIGMNLKTVRALTVRDNVVAGPFALFPFAVRTPHEAYVERRNVWRRTGGALFGWNGRALDFASYRKASGQGAGSSVSG